MRFAAMVRLNDCVWLCPWAMLCASSSRRETCWMLWVALYEAKARRVRSVRVICGNDE